MERLDTSSRAWPRHSLVRLRPGACHGVLLAPELDRETRDVLSAWARHAWPLVVRRPLTDDEQARGGMPVGLALPPSLGKKRLPFIVDLADIDSVRPPLALGEALDPLPDSWRLPLASLDRTASAHGIPLRIFGSVAWQALTGLSYLHDASDVDLLFRPRDRRDLAVTMELIERWERQTGLRADGEILFAEDQAVAWREWHATQRGNGQVLVKTGTRAYLAFREGLHPHGERDVAKALA